MGRRPKQPRDTYGAWLYHLRSELGLTQQALSDMTGIQQRTLAHWERTGKLAGRKEILALAKALKVSISQLLRENYESASTTKPNSAKSDSKPLAKTRTKADTGK